MYYHQGLPRKSVLHVVQLKLIDNQKIHISSNSSICSIILVLPHGWVRVYLAALDLDLGYTILVNYLPLSPPLRVSKLLPFLKAETLIGNTSAPSHVATATSAAATTSIPDVPHTTPTKL